MTSARTTARPRPPARRAPALPPAAPAAPPHPLLELQSSVGNAAVQRAIQRRVLVAGPATFQGAPLAAPWGELSRAQRRAFVRAHADEFLVQGRRRTGLAGRILDDMSAAGDDLRFSDEAELLTEVRKRVTTAVLMRVSQGVPMAGHSGYVHAFGYPNRPPAPRTGPRVNEAAAAYWGPPTRASDAYAFELSPAGRDNGFEALRTLFVLQTDPTKRTLIHCDYLTSVLHMRAFAESLGAEEFNRRVRSGAIPMVLRWNGFQDIVEGLASAGNASLQWATVASPADLVIGDHVIFYNHPLYDLIKGPGGVWRLENAILVDKRDGVDMFQGHGYTAPVTAEHMKESMLHHIRIHVAEVRQMIRRARSRNPDTRDQALADLAERHVVRDGAEWRVRGTAFGNFAVDEPLRIPRRDELPGLYHYSSHEIRVRRPIESR